MISDEAVETVAMIVYRTSGRKRVMSYEQARPTCMDEAREILEAAAPYMRSISAADIEAVADMIKAAKANGWDEGFSAGEDVGNWYAAPVTKQPSHTNPYRSQA